MLVTSEWYGDFQTSITHEKTALPVRRHVWGAQNAQDHCLASTWARERAETRHTIFDSPMLLGAREASDTHAPLLHLTTATTLTSSHTIMLLASRAPKSVHSAW